MKTDIKKISRIDLFIRPAPFSAFEGAIGGDESTVLLFQKVIDSAVKPAFMSEFKGKSERFRKL